MISGIAWDHINVFPTYDIYFDQFRQYVQGLDPGSQIIYNGEDAEVVRLIGETTLQLNSTPYVTPAFRYDDGYPIIAINGHEQKVSVFGRHNIQNIQAAIKVCLALGLPEDKCVAAIADFTGAARRLEKVKEEPGLLIYRDFAHAPSKLKATLNAVREAYPEHFLIACFELHTFSSLNEKFLFEYRGSMDGADRAVVYFSHHALELKGMPPLDKENVAENFGRADLTAVDEKDALRKLIESMIRLTEKKIFLLLMSSGTFDGIDWNTLNSHS